jgi:hypothetical protein
MSELETELKFLESHRSQLLEQYGGRILVIKGEEVTGAFETIEEALKDAAVKHGLSNVLIRRPSDPQVQVSIPALTLGILNANTTRPSTGTRSDAGR